VLTTGGIAWENGIGGMAILEYNRHEALPSTRNAWTEKKSLLFIT
jgi:hypothetical protein